MKRIISVLVVLTATVVSAGCGGTTTVTKTVTVSAPAKSGVGPPGEIVQFGYVKSLERPEGDHFVTVVIPELMKAPQWTMEDRQKLAAALHGVAESQNADGRIAAATAAAALAEALEAQARKA